MMEKKSITWGRRRTSPGKLEFERFNTRNLTIWFPHRECSLESIWYHLSILKAGFKSLFRRNATLKLITKVEVFSTFTYWYGSPFPFPVTTKLCPFTAPSIRSLIPMSGLITLCGVKFRLIWDRLLIHLTRSCKVKSPVKRYKPPLQHLPCW